MNTSDALRPWPSYRSIMWIGDRAYRDPKRLPLFFRRLREMGINTVMVYNDGNIAAVLESGLPYYVENIVNRGLCLKFHSKVSDWERFVTGWAKSRDEPSLVRDYCLDDPQWRDWAKTQMRELVRKNMSHQPLAYDIRDELSVTVSANPFDYDFSPIALAGFREWLRTRYPDLAALNREWETEFSTWEQVKPFTTDEIKARMTANQPQPAGKPDWSALQHLHFDPVTAARTPTRWNFSPWADFRSYMDLSLARALDDLRQSAHALDPHTPVGIEGTQMPAAFGGYDLWRLSQVLDWVEPYDIGNAREIFGSFMPGKVFLTTVGENDPSAAARRLWHLLLLGDRGCLVWWSEDSIAWDTADYQPTPRARSLGPVLREMTSPLAQLFLRARRETDPIAIHYSQASIQADWLLESTVDGSTWLRRFSSFEAEHNRMLKIRNSWLKALQDLGYSPTFVSSEQIERGELGKTHFRALVLPHSLALSERELREISAFLNSSGVVLCDGIPGLFDEHCRLRESGPATIFATARAEGCSAFANGKAKHSLLDAASYSLERLKAKPDLRWPEWIQQSLSEIPRANSVPLQSLARVHRYRLGSARLVAIERNINYQMSEDLKQAGGNQNLETAVDVELSFGKRVHVYDLRGGKYLGNTDSVSLRLDPWRPSLLALVDEKLTGEPVVKSLLDEASTVPGSRTPTANR